MFEDVSGIVYVYDKQGHRKIDNPYSIPGSIARVDRGPKDLFPTLDRLKQEMEFKNRRPWFDLTNSHYFTSKNGVLDRKDLRQALRCFGCTDVRSGELTTLLKTFPNEYGGFDFKQFVRAMFSNDGDRRKYINLRRDALNPQQFPQGFARPGAYTSMPGSRRIARFSGLESERWSRSIAAPPSNRIPPLSQSLPGYATSRGMYAWGFPRQPLARKPPPDPATMY
jgi:hypothetical protein